MSSILAIVSFDGSRVDPGDLRRMARAAPHRVGPSGTRSWSGPGAALGRTSCRDDRAGPSQPLMDEVVCVVDARIDGRAEICAAFGVRPDGPGAPSDARIVLDSFRRWGVGCAARLIGDFAVVVWDPQRRRLFAARDAMGARTMYLRREPGRTLIATEAKQLLAAPGVPRRPDEAALVADAAGLLALPSMTPFSGVEQLPPGHAMTADVDGVRIWRYWDIEPDRRIRHRTTADYAEHFRTLLTTAVRDRLRDAGPVGMFLSGGLDATSVAGVAAEVMAAEGGVAPPLRGFSWAFDELTDGDERHVSGPVADALGVAVTDVPADDAWPLKDFPAHGPDLDDPYVWLYQPLIERTLAMAHERGIVTMLTTDRGDEMVGNWVHDDVGLAAAGRLPTLLAEVRAHRQATGASIPAFVRDRIAKPLFTTLWPPHTLGRFRAPLQRHLGTPATQLAPWVPAAQARRHDLEDLARAGASSLPIHSHARGQRYGSVFHNVSLRVAQLRQRTFARHGLAYADPWGDRRIAEFVCAIPQWHVHRRGRPKLLTEEAVRGVIPEPARLRPARSNPVGLFRRAFNDRETATVRALLRDSRAEAAGLLDATAVLDVFETYLRGGDVAHDFWDPICVELWLRRWWD